MYHLFFRTMDYNGVVEGLGDYIDAFDTLEAAWAAIRDRRPFGYWIQPVLMQFEGGALKRVGELSASSRYEGNNRRASTYGWQIGDTCMEMEVFYEQEVVVLSPQWITGIRQWQASDPF